MRMRKRTYMRPASPETSSGDTCRIPPVVLSTLSKASDLLSPSHLTSRHIIEDAYGESPPPPAFLETSMRPKLG
eukprot:9258340-Pyramimonas_sp.AAC.1